MWQETVSPSVSNRTIVLLYKINMLPMWGGGGGSGNLINAALVWWVLQSINPTYFKAKLKPAGPKKIIFEAEFFPPPPSESSKEVTSGSPGQVNFLARQVTFKAFLPDVQGNKQVILLISKMGELLAQRTSCNSSPFSSSAPPLILGSWRAGVRRYLKLKVRYWIYKVWLDYLGAYFHQ